MTIAWKSYKNHGMGRHQHNHLGKIFGRWTVVASRGVDWLCRCECGSEKILPAGSLVSGKSRSCGCLRIDTSRERGLARSEEVRQRFAKANIRHGMAGTPTYSRFKSMWARCTDPTHKQFPGYGGRGIHVCHRWLEFQNFYDDMGVCPKGLSLERRNNDGPYDKANCTWATPREQALNRRTTVWVELYGHRACMKDWALAFGLTQNILWMRCRGRDAATVIDQLIFRNPSVKLPG